jgi:hypothetical protein
VIGVENHVFQHRAPSGDGPVNIRLMLLRKLDDLGVAAALEIVEHVACPPMLVIADKNRL